MHDTKPCENNVTSTYVCIHFFEGGRGGITLYFAPICNFLMQIFLRVRLFRRFTEKHFRSVSAVKLPVYFYPLVHIQCFLF